VATGHGTNRPPSYRWALASIAAQNKKKTGQRPRPSAESVWGRASHRFPRRADAWRPSVVRRLLGPLQFRTNFRTVKKKDVPVHATPIKKQKRQTTLSVLRRRRAAMRFRRRISLPRHVFCRFLFRDSMLPLCPHSILST
jgi:hypothetical protein